MNFPRIVLGYHGCLESRADELLTGRMPISSWPISGRKWEWLGRGIYFWEHAPERALQWAEAHAKRDGGKPAVVGAVILLGSDVLDLTDVRFAPALRKTHELLAQDYKAKNLPLPTNREKRHDLDCLIINELCNALPDLYGVVRGAFEEGEPVFPGSKIKGLTHVQLVVRNTSVIRGLFRPA